MSKKPIIWVLTDSRIGNANIALGVAEAMNLSFENKKIEYNFFGSFPNIFKGSSLLGVDKKNSSYVDSPFPDIVISTGRKTAPISKFIKKNNPDCFAVHMLWPGNDIDKFDLVVVPEHDNIEESEKIVNISGSTHKVTKELLKKEGLKWQEKLSYLSRPLVSLIIGGTTSRGEFTKEHAETIAKKASEICNSIDANLLVTTSRRTNDEAEKALKANISVTNYFHSWKTGGDNPYWAYLDMSDIIIVTGDSITMCSECTSTGKPVYIFAPDKILPKKHKRFHSKLYEMGFAKPLDEDTSDFEKWTYKPLNETKRVADLIKKRAL